MTGPLEGPVMERHQGHTGHRTRTKQSSASSHSRRATRTAGSQPQLDGGRAQAACSPGASPGDTWSPALGLQDMRVGCCRHPVCGCAVPATKLTPRVRLHLLLGNLGPEPATCRRLLCPPLNPVLSSLQPLPTGHQRHFLLPTCSVGLHWAGLAGKAQHQGTDEQWPLRSLQGGSASPRLLQRSWPWVQDSSEMAFGDMQWGGCSPNL